MQLSGETIIYDNKDAFEKELVKMNAIALEKACIAVQNQARIYVRKDTGFLRDSITYKVWDGAGTLPVGNPAKNSALIGTITVYAAYIEFTIEPYLRPALIDNRALIMQLISKELGDVAVTGLKNPKRTIIK